MDNKLIVEAGQCTQAGIKDQNEDCCGIRVPDDDMELTHKGIVAVTADGVGSSEAGKEASEHCVRGFITDYLSTPASWEVKTAGERILRSLNSWLYSQGQRRYASQLSLASTFAGLILKSTTAHLFHVGDSRIYRIREGDIRCLTKDHRFVVDRNKTYLSRAMGAEHSVQFDYCAIAMQLDDRFLLSSDGVHEFLTDAQLLAIVNQGEAEITAKKVVAAALAAGSNDNVTCQILHITQLPNQDEAEYYRQLTSLPFPPALSEGMKLDGYRIIKELHASVTVQVYLAEDQQGEQVVLKTPSVNFEDDPTYIDRFFHEVWVGRRLDNPHVYQVKQLKQQRSCLYYVTEFLSGRSLAQWVLDNPKPDLSKVRDLSEQIIIGLRAFQRREMVHQDIKPENIMIDQNDRIKIIDFGSTQVAGLKEVYSPLPSQESALQGTANYIAPELFEGFEGSFRSDMYSLAVVIYEMLSGGHFPYGKLEKAEAHKNYDYRSVRQYNVNVPIWMDGAIQKAVHPDRTHRYDSFSEFQHDLSTPNPAFMKTSLPLIERHPLAFWRGVSAVLLLTNFLLLALLFR